MRIAQDWMNTSLAVSYSPDKEEKLANMKVLNKYFLILLYLLFLFLENFISWNNPRNAVFYTKYKDYFV